MKQKSPMGFDPVRYDAMKSLATPKERFARIYKEGLWLNEYNPQESRSGSGSTKQSTETFRLALEKFLATHTTGGILLDAPCGDYNYMQYVKLPHDWQYIGADIVPEMIRDNQKHFRHVRFMVLDITQDVFPNHNVWLCRDCLFHLSFADIQKTLHQFCQSSGEHALITSHTNVDENKDIITGEFRPIDLTMPPFNLPPPLQVLADHPAADTNRYVGLWSKEQIKSSLRC